MDTLTKNMSEFSLDGPLEFHAGIVTEKVCCPTPSLITESVAFETMLSVCDQIIEANNQLGTFNLDSIPSAASAKLYLPKRKSIEGFNELKRNTLKKIDELIDLQDELNSAALRLSDFMKNKLPFAKYELLQYGKELKAEEDAKMERQRVSIKNQARKLKSVQNGLLNL